MALASLCADSSSDGANHFKATPISLSKAWALKLPECHAELETCPWASLNSPSNFASLSAGPISSQSEDPPCPFSISIPPCRPVSTLDRPVIISNAAETGNHHV